ncbi:MAG: S1 RNA-binding domain-containing protein [Syntrophobacteraceae bacterium]|nr:S1 RNA-binding domain-containing protein [Syntrophobacteraceae bacterium]
MRFVQLRQPVAEILSHDGTTAGAVQAADRRGSDAHPSGDDHARRGGDVRARRGRRAVRHDHGGLVRRARLARHVRAPPAQQDARRHAAPVELRRIEQAVARLVLERAGLSPDSPSSARKPAIDTLLASVPPARLTAELGCGLPTLNDILEQLVRPGRDPRLAVPAPILRSDVLKMEDLAVGMTLQGTVRNVVDFGAFIDIGVKHDGLLHKSRLPAGTLLKVGDILDLEILAIEPERGRISLALAR